MPTPNPEDATTHARGDVTEEQALCNAALESHSYDNMSDSEWVALCEGLAVKARETGTEAEAPAETSPPCN